LGGKRVKGSLRTTKRAQRNFFRVFILTLIIAIVAGTIGLTLFNKYFLDRQATNSVSTNYFESSEFNELPVTAEDIEILLPGTGIFAQAPYKDSKRVNALLLGTTAECLTDTIMFVSFDPQTKSVTLINIPRDTYYYREGYGGSWLKINSVFEDINHPGDPDYCDPMATATAVQKLLCGVPINYCAVVTYDGVEKIIDSMDGVPFDVPFDMRYTDTGHDNKDDLVIDLKAGQQTLTGAQAVQLLRFRQGYTESGQQTGYAEGDIGRVKMQQSFMKAAIKRALSLSKVTGVIGAVEANVDSNVKNRALLYIAQNSVGMNVDDVRSIVLPGASGMIDGLSFWQPSDSAVIEETMKQVYTNTLPAEDADETASDEEATE